MNFLMESWWVAVGPFHGRPSLVGFESVKFYSLFDRISLGRVIHRR